MSRLMVVWMAICLAVACTSSSDTGGGGGGPPKPVCGDGICDAATEINSCPADCGAGGNGSGSGSNPVCGNGVCEAGESSSSCPQDCSSVATCGDGICETSESSASCPADCGAPFSCTDSSAQQSCAFCFQDDADFYLGACDDFGDASPGTAADCAMCVANGTFGSACTTECTGGESLACAQCETVAAECGDSFCETTDGENEANCPADCPTSPCGDHICNFANGETSATCSMDCVLTDSFDCSNTTNQSNCNFCFEDDSTSFGGTPGNCDTNMDVTGGSAADCASCAAIGAFGSGCETACSSGENDTCATCVVNGG
jgi:hypothetical protein